MTEKATDLVQAGIAWDPAFGAVIPPLYMSSTYVWPEANVESMIMAEQITPIGIYWLRFWPSWTEARARS